MAIVKPGEVVVVACPAGEEEACRHRDHAALAAVAVMGVSNAIGPVRFSLEGEESGLNRCEQPAPRTPQPARKRRHWHADPLMIIEGSVIGWCFGRRA